MLKETTYQEKIASINPWLVEVVDVVKKDLKQEHLRIDKDFCRRYFLGKGPHQVTSTEMATAYAADIAAGNVGLGEFIATRWLIKNTDVYDFFANKLQALTPDFDKIPELDPVLGEQLAKEAVGAFGAVRTYLFSVLNFVAFSSHLMEQLRQQAEKETVEGTQKQEELLLEKNLQNLQRRHQREISALMERHEKQLSGLQKKYLKDTELLKEHVRRLQSQLNSQ